MEIPLKTLQLCFLLHFIFFYPFFFVFFKYTSDSCIKQLTDMDRFVQAIIIWGAETGVL